MAKILRKSAGSLRRGNTCDRAEGKREKSKKNDYAALLKYGDDVYRFIRLNELYHLGDDKGNDALKNYLEEYKKRCDDGRRLEFPYAFEQSFYHFLTFPLRKTELKCAPNNL